jgi:hypothetical protein
MKSLSDIVHDSAKAIASLLFCLRVANYRVPGGSGTSEKILMSSPQTAKCWRSMLTHHADVSC